MLLAIDTSTSAIGVAVHDGARVLAEVVREDARRHGELLAPAVVQVLQDAGIERHDLTRVVCGVGPGPFTGLRVGVVTALVLAHSLGLPTPDGVCSLDALAHAMVGEHEGELLVATDARRKEVYWARYRCAAGEVTLLDEPAVTRPTDLPDDVRALPTVGRGPLLYPDLLAHPLDLAGEGADTALLDVDAGVLAALAARRIAAGEEMPVEPLYLRRPDAVAPASTAPKSALKPSPRQQQRDLRQGERAGRGAEASQ